MSTVELASPKADVFIPPYEGRAVAVSAGDLVQLINEEGEQISDTWAVNPEDPAEVMSTIFTRSIDFHIYPKPGDTFFSNRGRPMLAFLEDTSPGKHDLLCHACSPHFFEKFGGDPDHPSCWGNFLKAMEEFGTPMPTVPDPTNFFQDTPVQPDGTFRFETSPAAAGDYVLLRAEMDLIFVAASCSFDLVGLNDARVNGEVNTPLRIRVFAG
jgi:uncharacterized protein YcgI (DUF1989 family)